MLPFHSMMMLLMFGCVAKRMVDSADDSDTNSTTSDDSAATHLFKQVQLSLNSGCALDDVGGISCWGADPYGVSRPPDGEYTSYSLGVVEACGLTTGNALTCWGDSSYIAGGVNAGVSLSQISVGYHTLCGVAAGAVVCWGDDIDGNDEPPSGTFVAVGTDQGLSCALDDAGAVTCWGDNSYGELDDRPEAFSPRCARTPRILTSKPRQNIGSALVVGC